MYKEYFIPPNFISLFFETISSADAEGNQEKVFGHGVIIQGAKQYYRRNSHWDGNGQKKSLTKLMIRDKI